MALGRHLAAALPGSSTGAPSILVAGEPSTVVVHVPSVRLIMHTDQPLPDRSTHRQGAPHALTLHRFTRALGTRPCR